MPKLIMDRHGMTAATGTYRVRILRSSGTVQERDLGEGPFTVGRSPRNSLVLEDTMASRNHARFELRDGAWILTDLGAKNTTLVNGQPIQVVELRGGDEILIGDTKLIFVAPKESGFTPPPPPPPPEPEPEPDPLPAPLPVAMPPAPSPTAPSGPPPPPVPDPGGLVGFVELLAGADQDLQNLEHAAERLIDLIPCDRAIVLLVEEGGRRPVMQFSRETDDAAAVVADEDEFYVKALEANEPEALDASAAAERMGAAMGLARQLALVPMQAAGSRLGVVILERTEEREGFDEDALDQARIAAAQIAAFVRLLLR